MTKAGNIILVGPMGAGKTTIGRQLARELGLPFVDSDVEIEARAGVAIPTIFEYEGEAGFRRREQKVIAELVRLPGIVLATGGGAVLLLENRRALAEHGYVVYLACSIDHQLERTQLDPHRPLLNTPNPRARLAALMKHRGPLYREVADLVVDSGGNPAKRTVRTILNRYRQFLRKYEE